MNLCVNNLNETRSLSKGNELNDSQTFALSLEEVEFTSSHPDLFVCMFCKMQRWRDSRGFLGNEDRRQSEKMGGWKVCVCVCVCVGVGA